MTERKTYYSVNRYLRDVFGEKVIKVGLSAGMSCPNRDGTLGRGGCVFCSKKGSGDFAGEGSLPIKEQFVQVRDRTLKKWPQAKYMAYFQSYTATYGEPEYLASCYEEALSLPGVVGLAVSTRPDCLPPAMLDILADLNKRTFLWVELGLQSVHDKTLRWMNRGHDYACFLKALADLTAREIRVCVHLILGLPCETREDMLVSAQTVAALPVHGVKLHALNVLKETPLAEMYCQRPFSLLTMAEYTALVVDILKILPPEMIIHRLTGDGPAQDIIAPDWIGKKWEVLNAINRSLQQHDRFLKYSI